MFLSLTSIFIRRRRIPAASVAISLFVVTTEPKFLTELGSILYFLIWARGLLKYTRKYCKEKIITFVKYIDVEKLITFISSFGRFSTTCSICEGCVSKISVSMSSSSCGALRFCCDTSEKVLVLVFILAGQILKQNNW